MLALIIIAFISFIFATYFGFKALMLRNGNLNEADNKKSFRNNLIGFFISFVSMLTLLLCFTEKYLKV